MSKSWAIPFLSVVCFITWLGVTAPQARAELPKQTDLDTPIWGVKQITTIEGLPFRVTYNNGAVIAFKERTIFAPLDTTIVLVDNACTRAIDSKGQFLIPTIFHSIIPYWLIHPTRQGQPVFKFNDDDKKQQVVASVTAFQTRLNEVNFDKYLSALDKSQILDADAAKTTLANPGTFGWFSCPNQKCKNILPKRKDAQTVRWWSENFEMTNDQLQMSSNMEGVTVNQFTSRLESVPIAAKKGKIFFGMPSHISGLFAKLFPPGITYQIQWIFKAPNLLVKDDDHCEMKWDLDFTRVFTQFTKAGKEVSKPEKMNLAAMPDYIFRKEDADQLLFGDFFQEDNWNDSEVSK